MDNTVYEIFLTRRGESAKEELKPENNRWNAEMDPALLLLVAFGLIVSAIAVIPTYIYAKWIWRKLKELHSEAINKGKKFSVQAVVFVIVALLSDHFDFTIFELIRLYNEKFPIYNVPLTLPETWNDGSPNPYGIWWNNSIFHYATLAWVIGNHLAFASLFVPRLWKGTILYYGFYLIILFSLFSYKRNPLNGFGAMFNEDTGSGPIRKNHFEKI